MGGPVNEQSTVEFHGYTVHEDSRVSRKGKFLKPTWVINRNGRTYYKYYLYINRKLERWYAHRLVAWCFLGPFPDGDFKLMVVDHVDNDSRNNHLDNLEVVTQVENLRRRRAMENDDANECPF